MTAVQYTSPDAAEEICALAEASTNRRPAFLPPLSFEQARVYLDDQRCMVFIPKGHWLVIVPSGPLVVLSSVALSSILPTSARES